MRSFNSIVSDFQVISNDSSGSTTALGKILVNQGIKKFLNLSDWNFNKSFKNYATGTSVQYLDLPSNVNKVDYVWCWYGNRWYNPTEVKLLRNWQILNQVTVTSSLITNWFYDERTKQVGLFPLPNDSQGTVKIGFTKKIIDYSASDYSTGSVSASANGTVFSGKSTSWGSQMAGRYIQVNGTNTPADGFWMEIDSVGSTGSLYTKEAMPNAVSGATTYVITQMIPFPEGFEQMPLNYALDKYYQMKEKPVLAREYERMWRDDLENLQRRDEKTVTGLMKREGFDALDVNTSPWHITLSE